MSFVSPKSFSKLNYIRDTGVLKQRTKDIEIKKFAVKLMEEKGSFKYTLGVLEKLDTETRNEVETLGDNPHLTTLLNELVLKDCCDKED